nr:uncharacterized protein LOC124808656 [Hydra vulgaris]
MWPILCTVNQQGPYTIALWYGEGKPTILREYFEKFVAEMKFFFINGYVGLKVMVKAFVCNAPARAFLKCIKGHSGYDSCERYQEHGEYNKGIRLLGTKSLLRDDKKFKENFYLKHQIGKSPLSDIEIRMVTGFVLDYMHLVCLGITKKLMKNYINNIGSSVHSKISSELLEIRKCTPSDFH